MPIKTDYFPGSQLKSLDGDGAELLINTNGISAAPIVDHLIFFNETDIFSQELLVKKVSEIRDELAESEKEYERFVRQKGRRPNLDIYACFQPFNEAYKAFFPFLKTLKGKLAPGDIILNLWDRTGYTACFLAGLFPEQKVINIWEGNKDTLGYKGFHFWYRDESLTNNPIQIAFADLNSALPFADDSIGLVVGLDTLHRFPLSSFLGELFRVTKNSAAILFPHVHLTNSEPEPFFERGCRQLSGKDYAAFFEVMSKQISRKGYLLPEPEMFLFNETGPEVQRAVFSSPESHHYNTSIAILPEDWEESESLQPFRFDDLPKLKDARILVNPLVEIDWCQQIARNNPTYLSGQVGYLLERHPVYLKKLVTEQALDDLTIKVLYWAMRLFTIAEIAERLNVEQVELIDRLRELQQQDIIQVVPLSAQHLRLQYFVSTQQYRVPSEEQTLSALWNYAQKHFAENPYIFSEADESEITFEEADQLVALIRQALKSSGLSKADRLMIIGRKHFESILTVQAATHLGIVVVPVDPELAPATLKGIIDDVSPSLLLTDQVHSKWISQLDVDSIQLDEDTETAGIQLFSDWLDIQSQDVSCAIDLALTRSEDDACILYTSGSTGVPKGIPLTHGQLFRSGRLITETFHWRSTDRFFSPGDLDSMSGFRNYCIAPLETGTAIILSHPDKNNHLFSLVETIELYQATIIGTTPALLSQLLQYQKRVSPKLKSIRSVICTGSNLAPSIKQQCQEVFEWVPLNYYGLTETTGICLSEDIDNYQLDSNTVGIPRDAIAQIVDEEGNVVVNGEKGELRIYSENIALSYLGKKSNALIKNDWLYTGDIARWHENGHLALLGRSRQIIKLASGQLIFASEIENQLLTEDDIVVNAAVTGQPDKDGIERILAFIQLKSQNFEAVAVKNQLRKKITEQLGKRKVPDQWIFVEKMPVNSSGKIQKANLINQHFSK